MANISPNEKAARNPKCARCRNHGLLVPLKGHSGKCQFRPCVCWKCSLIAERTKILASQRRIKTGNVNVNESPSADRPENFTRSNVSRKTVAGSNNTLTNGVNDEPDSRQESAIKVPIQRSDTDGKTYTELQAPVTLTGSVSASTGYCELKAPTGLSTPGDPPHIPGEYIITEAIPRHIFPGEMFAMPVPVYPHYPDRYMYPAVLVTLGPPAPGTFREPIGFLPSPPATLSYPLETPESQFHMPCYSPYPTYPILRDEHGPRPHHHMDGEQGISKFPPIQAECTTEGHVSGNQEPEVVPADGFSSKNTA